MRIIPQLWKPGDQITSDSMNRMAFLMMAFAFTTFIMMIAYGISVHYMKQAFAEIDTLKSINAQQDSERIALESEMYMQLASMDVRLTEANHELEVMQSQVEIIDESINGKEKRRARMTKVIAAIKATLPEYGNPIPGCPKQPSPGELWSIAGAIVDNSEEYAVPASFIAAVIRQESAYCNQAVSPVGARGYMQLMPDTAAQVSADVAVKTGRALRTWRGRDNIQLGTAYLSDMLLEFDGNLLLAAAAYNGGPTHVKKVLAGLTSEYYRETADYMQKVVQYQQEYERLGL